MSLYNDIYNKILDDINRRIEAAIPAAEEMAYAHLEPIILAEMGMIMTIVASKFYSDYSPKKYSRAYDVENAIVIESDAGSKSFGWDWSGYINGGGRNLEYVIGAGAHGRAYVSSGSLADLYQKMFTQLLQKYQPVKDDLVIKYIEELANIS